MRAAVVAGLITFAALAAGAAEPVRPNFVIFLVDDLGWADLGCYGSTFYETPNLDRFAASGVRFTNAYSAGSVCSPTRASLMTGRYPARVGITDYLPGLPGTGEKLVTPADRDELPLQELTVAEALKEHGYRTFYGGKWHLGGKGFEPQQQGSDVYVDAENGNWQKDPLESDRLTNAALEFIGEEDPARPFFSYISFHKVHTPILPYPKHIGRFREKAGTLPTAPEPTPERNGLTRARQDDPEYASEVAAVDGHVGRVLARLDELGIADETVVIFMSDNGGLSTRSRPGPTANLPLRAGKGWLYEGGIRIPLLVRAPGVTTAGAVCDVPVVTTDFFPTVLELAGLPPLPARHVDGVSLVPVLKDCGRGDALRREAIYWHYPHYHGSTWAPGGAVRAGNWKLIELFEDGATELYDLVSDPGERRDLSREQPEKRDELLRRLRDWRREVGAAMPTPNPARREERPR